MAIAAGLLVSAAGAAVIGSFLIKLGRTPRQWAPYLTRRAEDHNPVIMGTAAMAAGYLVRADRIPGGPKALLPNWIGASTGHRVDDNTGTTETRLRFVDSLPALNAALASAVPGEIIELLPGRYPIKAGGIYISRAGQPAAPITLRASRLGEVVLESATTEAIKINAPNWHFENLVMRGVCGQQQDCEHAFHVVGKAKGTLIRNNLLVDFNAQIKVNGENGGFPDDGIIEDNTLTDTRPRATASPVTPIDIDAASGWKIRGNLITDFGKSEGDRISYGAFAKAAGDHNSFERNVVLCETRASGDHAKTIGLSLGGGGSAQAFSRDDGSSGLEHNDGLIRDNLIAFCSDVGIYLNKAMNSRIEHNTLLDTSGIEVRFPQSSANIQGNIIDGIISVRDGAAMHAQSNEIAPLLGLFFGWHPQRRIFTDVAYLDLTWRGSPPREEIADPRPDLCGTPRPPQPVIGAFEDFATCLSRATK